ncbi:hypothetical protein VNO77_03878 [Canavalia gladiata]|uniref:Uncharacterized protein n=1 Tax=Canavalia gladiata TaxID=3824 RepID=A0AAN9N167_CANGL
MCMNWVFWPQHREHILTSSQLLGSTRCTSHPKNRSMHGLVETVACTLGCRTCGEGVRHAWQAVVGLVKPYEPSLLETRLLQQYSNGSCYLHDPDQAPGNDSLSPHHYCYLPLTCLTIES